MPIISPKIPSGLEELMRGLAKSCIKENPDNIYLYAAEYFENLLKERDGAVDQNYKKFATYKVYKKNKSARLKRGKQNSNDVNALPSVNGFKRDENDVSGERKDSIEEIVLSETSKPQQAVVKSQSSIISSESEITTEVKKEASVDIEGVPSQSQEDDEVQNMVLDDDMAHAALKIQSSFRGHKVRREMRDAKLECEDEKVIDEQSTSEAPSGDDFPSEGEKQHENEIKESEAEINVVSENEIVKNDAEAEIDTIETTETESLVIDDDIENMVLNEEMEEAALKIQASFRGARVRREIKPLVDNDVEDVEEAEQTEEMQQDGEVESEQTKEIQQGDEIEFEQTCDEEKVSDVETIVEESEKAHVENIEEIATIIMEEEIENQGAKKDTENPQETFEPQIEETIPQDDIVNIDDAPETENIVECVNDDVTYSEEPLETEKNVDASENFDDTSVKEENLQVDTEDAKEQEKVNDINDEAITEDEDINKAEALSADAIQFTEVVDDSLIEPTPSVDAIEADKSTIGDCEKINKTFEASEEKEEIVETENGIIDEEKQVSDETKFVRPPTIENELLSIENDDDLLPEVLNETQAETIKGSLDNEEKLETEQSEIDEIIIDESLSECIKDEEKAIEGEKVVEEEETIEKLNEIIEEKLVETEKNLNELDESSIKNQKVSLEEFENLIGNEENFADNKENLIGNNEGSIENVDISVEAKENSIEKVEKSGNIEENCEQHVETEETFIEKENLNEGEEKLIKSSENSVEGEEVIELTDNLKTSVGEENVNENENYEKQPQKASDLMEEGRNVEVNEQEPQKESSVLPKESETESFEKNVVLPSDEIDGGKSPVVEEICTKKSIGMLEPDQENLESEIVEFPLNKELSVDPNVNGNESDLQDDIKTLPSGEIEYASLKESFSEHDGSIDEVDNKSGDLTDEKSIDNDTTGSRQNSMEDKLNEIQEDVNELLAADEQEIVSAANDIEQNETSQNLIEPILHTEISPMELMDEIVNECAGAVANEIIFTSQVEPVESNLTKSVESENAEKAEGEIVEPKLMEKNPFEEIAAKSIDLSQEILHRSEDEMEPIRDEILKPEGEESEIPEESQAPVDKNIPVVAMEEKSPSIETDEQMPQEENRGDEKVEEKSPQEDDDDVLDMVLDEEMEDAALKIQAAFRGHKVRKEKLSCAETEQESSQQDEEESQKVDVNVVIDQCSEDNVESQENEETEQQDTSADCEEIQESEAGDQEETQEGRQLAFDPR